MFDAHSISKAHTPARGRAHRSRQGGIIRPDPDGCCELEHSVMCRTLSTRARYGALYTRRLRNVRRAPNGASPPHLSPCLMAWKSGSSNPHGDRSCGALACGAESLFAAVADERGRGREGHKEHAGSNILYSVWCAEAARRRTSGMKERYRREAGRNDKHKYNERCAWVKQWKLRAGMKSCESGTALERRMLRVASRSAPQWDEPQSCRSTGLY